MPGRRPTLLVTGNAVKARSAGSVIVDMGADTLSGNVSGSRPGQAGVAGNGITIVGADNLSATMPTAASNGYSPNVATLLEYMTSDGALAIDTSDEIQAGVVIKHDGRVVAAFLEPAGHAPEGGVGVDGPADCPDHLHPRAAGRHRGHRGRSRPRCTRR